MSKILRAFATTYEVLQLLTKKLQKNRAFRTLTQTLKPNNWYEIVSLMTLTHFLNMANKYFMITTQPTTQKWMINQAKQNI